MTDKDIIKAARKYVDARIVVVKCRQKNFRQLCSRCSAYAICECYLEYCRAWTTLERGVI